MAGIAFVLFIAVDLAAASEQPLLVNAPPAEEQDKPDERVTSVFALLGLDVTSVGSVYEFGEITAAPSGNIDQSGVRLRGMEGYGIYKVAPGGGQADIRGTTADGSLLAGYGFVRDNYSVDLYAGLDVENDRLSAPDPQDRVQGTQVGVKGVGELWWTPTPQTLVFGLAEYSTAFQTYYAKAKLGYDALSGKQEGKEIFIGPEFIALGDERYSQQRIGIHVTAIHIRSVNLELSGGYLHDSNLGGGAYSIIEINTQF